MNKYFSYVKNELIEVESNIGELADDAGPEWNNNRNGDLKTALETDADFDIEELTDSYRISGISYGNDFCTYDFAKKVLPNQMPEQHAQCALTAKDSEFRASNTPLIYAICKTLYLNKHGSKKGLVEGARKTLEDIIGLGPFINTLSRAVCNINGEDEIIHDDRQKTQYSIKTNVVGPDGCITDKNTKAREYCQAFFDTTDTVEEINEVFKWVTGKETYARRPNRTPRTKYPETEYLCVIELGVGGYDQFILNTNGVIIGSRPALGVRCVQKSQCSRSSGSGKNLEGLSQSCVGACSRGRPETQMSKYFNYTTNKAIDSDENNMEDNRNNRGDYSRGWWLSKLWWLTSRMLAVLGLSVVGSMIAFSNFHKQYEYVSPMRIRIESKDIDSQSAGLEQLVAIDGEEYILKEKQGEPILVQPTSRDSAAKYISPGRIEAKVAELDRENIRPEQLLILDRKRYYTIQERNGKPILVRYTPKKEDDDFFDPLNPLNPSSPIFSESWGNE